MMRVISSPSSSTTGLATLILSMMILLGWNGPAGPRKGGAVEAIAGAQDRSQRRQMPPLGRAPAVILSSPQMGENIGAAARAMANFGLSEMRLIAPKTEWPNDRAKILASG